jgi:hypothetical protein
MLGRLGIETQPHIRCDGSSERMLGRLGIETASGRRRLYRPCRNGCSVALGSRLGAAGGLVGGRSGRNGCSVALGSRHGSGDRLRRGGLGNGCSVALGSRLGMTTENSSPVAPVGMDARSPWDRYERCSSPRSGSVTVGSERMLGRLGIETRPQSMVDVLHRLERMLGRLGIETRDGREGCASERMLDCLGVETRTRSTRPFGSDPVARDARLPWGRDSITTLILNARSPWDRDQRMSRRANVRGRVRTDARLPWDLDYAFRSPSGSTTRPSRNGCSVALGSRHRKLGEHRAVWRVGMDARSLWDRDRPVLLRTPSCNLSERMLGIETDAGGPPQPPDGSLRRNGCSGALGSRPQRVEVTARGRVGTDARSPWDRDEGWTSVVPQIVASTCRNGCSVALGSRRDRAIKTRSRNRD